MDTGMIRVSMPLATLLVIILGSMLVGWTAALIARHRWP